MTALDPERWRRIQPLLDEALTLPPDERDDWLDRVCAGDPELRAMFDRVLRADAQTGGFLDAPLRPIPETVLDDLSGGCVSEFRGTERFTVLRRLGAGGMGVVYAVHDRVRDDVVALKTLRHRDPAGVVRLKREFRTLADIAHPNLVSLYELIAGEAGWFFTMELVDGVDVVKYIQDQLVDDTSRFERTRDVLRQVVGGIAELHRRGKLHRDIKPPNIMVTPAGRAVILDFGISSDLSSRNVTVGDRLAGTPAYLAPERSVGGAPEPSHDWYGLGVTLYQAITGRQPFDRSMSAQQRRKDDADPPLPSEIAQGVPHDLDTICMGLLRRDPSQRFGPHEVMRLLVKDVIDRVAPLASESEKDGTFVGRRHQLEVLDAALTAAKQGTATAVYVHGPSGIGKSALLQCFLDRAVDREEVIVLRGRCYEHESVPYKGFDGVIDSLSQFLSGMPRAQAEPLIPVDVAALMRLFPVTLQANAIQSKDRVEPAVMDPVELRQRAFAALRELLCRLADRQPLILCIDDFHWADADSAMLLRELVRPPHAPPALTIVCLRDEEIAAQPFLQHLLADTGSAARVTLPVGPMSDDEAYALALSIIPADEPRGNRDIEHIVRESSGNPFLLGQLARHNPWQKSPHERTATFTDVFSERVGEMSDAAQRYLQMLALCGRPMPPAIVYEACGLDGDDRRLVAQLRSEHLLRSSGSAQRIELYHDRIREALVTLIDADERRRLHHCMACTLVARGAGEPEALFEHYRGAEDHEDASTQAGLAAAKACATLAFDRAAFFYRQALALRPASPAAAVWKKGLADALANAGQPAEAAESYLRAAAGADHSYSVELQRRAAEQFLVAGDIDRGLDLVRTVLAGMGMRVPRSRRAAFAWLLWRRARLRWRGLRFVPQPIEVIDKDALLRIDTCWSAAAGLALVDVIGASEFNVRHLHMALDAGDSYRIARAMAIESAFRSGDPTGRTFRARLVRESKALARSTGDPHAIALSILADGMVAMTLGQWKSAFVCGDQATAILRDQCVGVTWELNMAQNLTLWALLYQGQLGELSRRVPVLLANARSSGNWYVATELCTRSSYVWLAADEPDEGERVTLDAIGRWSHKGFHRQHYSSILTRIQIALYRGDADGAWRLLDDLESILRQTYLRRVQVFRIEALYLRARSALAMASVNTSSRRFRSIVRAEALRIERERMPWSDPIALLLRAGIAFLEGSIPVALRYLYDAADRFEHADMRLHAAVARRRIGALQDDAAGRELQRQAEDWMATQHIKNPASMTRMLAPGFPDAK